MAQPEDKRCSGCGKPMAAIRLKFPGNRYEFTYICRGCDAIPRRDDEAPPKKRR